MLPLKYIMENQDDKLKERTEKMTAKLEIVRAVKKLSDPNSPFTLTQELMQEVHAAHLVSNPDKKPSVSIMMVDLRKEIEARYADDETLRNLLLDSIPSNQAIQAWLKKDGWEEAVWRKIRGESLFSPQKRAQVIEALRDRALDKSDVAAKIWLTLSGDYSEKMEVSDKSLDAYREINGILHNKRKSEE